MPIQREDTDSETDIVADLPAVLPPPKPKRVASEAQRQALALGRQRKAELKEQRDKERQESLVLAQQVKKIKDPEIKNTIKEQVIKANVVRQKKPHQEFPVPPETPPPSPPASPQPIQKVRKQPKVILQDEEPEVIYVKVPKKKIVVQQSETESEIEPPKPRSQSRASLERRTRKPRPPVETDESDFYDEVKPAPIKQPARPAPVRPASFKINF